MRKTQSRPLSLLLALLLATAMLPAAPAEATGTWEPQMSGTTEALHGVYALNANRVWVVGSGGVVLKTTDGGQVWSPVSVGTTELLTDVQFLDENVGYIVGWNSTVLKTTNGGVSWTMKNEGLGTHCKSVYFLNPTTGYVGGLYGNLWKTTDGGENWAQVDIVTGGQTTSVNAVHWFDESNGLIQCSGYFSSEGEQSIVLQTLDGGVTWEYAQGPQNRIVHWAGIAVQDNNHAVVAASGAMYLGVRDTESGYFLFPDWSAGRANDVDFVDANRGCAVGWRYEHEHPSVSPILTTTDGGTTWNPEAVGSGYFRLYGVDFVDAQHGWAVGADGTIIAYTHTGPTVSVSAEAPAPAELSLTFSVTAGTAPDGGSVTGSAVDFAMLAPSAPKTGSHVLQVTTNASNGYQVTGAEDTPLTSGAYTIPDVTGDGGDITESAAGAWNLATTYGFGYTLADQTGTAAAFTSGFKQFADTSAAESAQILMQGLAATTGDAVDLTYKLNIGPAQPQGTYTNTVTYIATGNL